MLTTRLSVDSPLLKRAAANVDHRGCSPPL